MSRCFTSVRASGPWSSARFNTHSLAVATLSDLIVQSVPSEHPEWAFMAGLLHDIGLPPIAVGLPEQYRIIAMQAGSEVGIAESERCSASRTLIWERSCSLAGTALRFVQEATRFGDSADFPNERPLSLGDVVKTASQLADASGISIFDSSEDNDLAIQLLEALGIPAPLAGCGKKQIPL